MSKFRMRLCCNSPAIYRNTKGKIKGVKKVRQYLRAAAKHTETAGEIMQTEQTTILNYLQDLNGRRCKKLQYLAAMFIAFFVMLNRFYHKINKISGENIQTQKWRELGFYFVYHEMRMLPSQIDNAQFW